MTHVVSEIFKDGPVDRFSLRGDPVFWNYLEKHFQKVAMPYSERKLEEDIRTIYQDLTGKEFMRNLKKMMVLECLQTGYGQGG